MLFQSCSPWWWYPTTDRLTMVKRLATGITFFRSPVYFDRGAAAQWKHPIDVLPPSKFLGSIWYTCSMVHKSASCCNQVVQLAYNRGSQTMHSLYWLVSGVVIMFKAGLAPPAFPSGHLDRKSVGHWWNGACSVGHKMGHGDLSFYCIDLQWKSRPSVWLTSSIF